MTLILEVALGVVLGLWLWRLPDSLRRKKARRIFLALSSGEAALAAMNAELYTDQQRTLLLNLAATADLKQREDLVDQLVNTFPD